MAKTKQRMTKNLEMDHVGALPDWRLVESHEDENFSKLMNTALRHYGYFNTVKDLKKAVIQWMTNNDYTATSVKAYKKSLDWRTPMTACSLAAAYNAGMPDYPRATAYITESIAEAVAHNDVDGVEQELSQDEKDAAPKKHIPSIQERITNKINDHILHFEITYEDGIIERGEKHSAPDVRSYLVTENVPPSMIARIVEHFQAQMDEIKGSQGKNADEQLAEGYKHLSKADVKRFTDFYKALIADLEMHKEEKKATRVPRQRKAVSKAKQVAKLNYMKRHDGLKLVSVNPEDLVDCKELWIYQSKYRKLGKFVAEEYGTLGVKGTTITGFDPNKSVQKGLRKPKEQLAEFKKAGKVKLRTLLEDIKTVDIKLTGRINKDTILLKAV